MVKIYCKWSKDIANGQKILQMVKKYTNIPRPSKIYPNSFFGTKINYLATLFPSEKEALQLPRSRNMPKYMGRAVTIMLNARNYCRRKKGGKIFRSQNPGKRSSPVSTANHRLKEMSWLTNANGIQTIDFARRPFQFLFSRIGTLLVSPVGE
jgi:hypothetical protein